MIEISQIIFQLFLLIFLTLFPLNKYLFAKNNIIKDLNFFSVVSINSLFLMFLLLIFSFLKINIIHIFYFIIFTYSILLIKILIKQRKKIVIKNPLLFTFVIISSSSLKIIEPIPVSPGFTLYITFCILSG